MRKPVVVLLLSLPLALPLTAGAACFEEAAMRYRVPVPLLKAISTVESGGRADAYNRNKNGSYDIGHMQINSAWLPTLAQYRITHESLKDPCVNTHVGAWVLAQNIHRFGFSWKAVGAYNAASDSKRLIYARKVAKQLEKEQRAWGGNNQFLTSLAERARNG